MANVIINNTRLNNINAVELQDADNPNSQVRFLENGGYTAGEGINIVNDTISINTANASAGNLLSFDGQHVVWAAYVPLTSAEVTSIVNSIQ